MVSLHWFCQKNLCLTTSLLVCLFVLWAVILLVSDSPINLLIKCLLCGKSKSDDGCSQLLSYFWHSAYCIVKYNTCSQPSTDWVKGRNSQFWLANTLERFVDSQKNEKASQAPIRCQLANFNLRLDRASLWQISLRQVNEWPIPPAESSGPYFMVLVTSSPVSGKFVLYIPTKLVTDQYQFQQDHFGGLFIRGRNI
jgi:hypothetical protein